MKHRPQQPRSPSASDLRELLAEKEELKLEFKLKYDLSSGPRLENRRGEFTKDIISLANTAGRDADDFAYLVIGAGDELRADGTRAHESIQPGQYSQQSLLQIVNAACRPELGELLVSEIKLEETVYAVIILPPSPYVHCFSKDVPTGNGVVWRKNVVPLRSGEAIIVASQEAIEFMASQKAAWSRLCTAASVSADQARTISENFVLDPSPETLPKDLLPREDVVHRDEVVENLKALFAEYRSGCLVTLTGPPAAGKSAVFRQLAVSLSKERLRDPPVAVLYVDLGNSQRPLKAFDLALRRRRSRGQASAPFVSLAAVEDGEDEEQEEPQVRQFESVQASIDRSLGNHSLVVFLERYSDRCGDEGCVSEMQRIVGFSTFRRAFSLLESYGDTIPGLALSDLAIQLEPFTPTQAAEFLIQKGQPGERAKGAIELLSGDVLYPGMLRQGAVRCSPQVAALTRESPTAIDLALAINAKAADVSYGVIEKLCAAAGHDADAAMISLMAMSVFSDAEISFELLTKAGLAPIPMDRLLRLGWLERPDGTRLGGFGRSALQSAAALTLSGRAVPGEWRADELRSAIRRLCSVLFGQGWTLPSSTLDTAVAWLRTNAGRETELLNELQVILAQVTAADSVSSFTDEQERRAALEFFRRGAENKDFDAALAALVLYARGSADELAADGRSAGANFLECLQQVTELIQSGFRLNARQLFAVDAAIFSGSRRFRIFREALQVRKATCAALLDLEAAALSGRDGPWLSAWMSFLMNAADLSLSCGDQQEALVFTAHARRIEEETRWLKDNSWKQWRLARLSLLRARLADNAAEEKAEIIDAVERAEECLRLAPDDPGSIRFYLRTVRRLVKAEGDDSVRKRHIDDAIAHLEEVLGPRDNWDVSVRAQTAALMREEAQRAWDAEYQRDRVQQALRLLRATRPRRSREINADPRALLCQARLQAFLGEAEAALGSCNKALALDPTPSAWRLKLRLLDVSGGGQDDHHWSEDIEVAVPNFAPISPELREAIREFRNSAAAHDSRTPSYGSIELRIIEREYGAEGSLERHVARQLLRHQQIDYYGLPKHEKLQRLSVAFRRRESQLKGVGNRFGASPALTLAEFRNTAQYIRSVSVLTQGPPDVDEVLAVIDRGLERWPGNHVLLFHRAEYLLYLWDVDAAIGDFRKLRVSATDGDLRRRAAVSLARALRIAIVHRENADPGQRAEWLREAKQILDDLSGSFKDAKELAILRDHISLESGDSIDWMSLKDVYHDIIGKIDGFPTTLLTNYDRMLGSAGRPINVAQVLQSSFADPEILGLTGSLYLARAQKNIGNRQQEDFTCAVAFFRAQALVERSWMGQEYPATSFRIGRAIVSAGDAFRSPNPIHGLDTDRSPDQLALAEAILNSASSRSTGVFRHTTRMWQSRATRLRAELLNR